MHAPIRLRQNRSRLLGRSLIFVVFLFLAFFAHANAAWAQAQGMWASKAGMPTQRTGNAVVAVNLNVYSVGGQISPTDCAPLSNFETYNATTNVWSVSPPMPTARFNAAAASLNGKLYVAGGQTDCSTAVPTLEMYDPVANAWSTKRTCPRRDGAWVWA